MSELKRRTLANQTAIPPTRSPDKVPHNIQSATCWVGSKGANQTDQASSISSNAPAQTLEQKDTAEGMLN